MIVLIFLRLRLDCHVTSFLAMTKRWDTHTRIKYIKATYSIAELYGHNLLCREKIVKIVLKYDFCYDMIEK